MSSPTQARPVVTFYPSAPEDVTNYLASMRLASSVRTGGDAVNTDSHGRHHPPSTVPVYNLTSAARSASDADESAVNADSYGRHHPTFLPPTGPVYNKTSAAEVASDAGEPGFVHPRDGDLSPRYNMSTADAHTNATPVALKGTGYGITPEVTAADAPAGIKLEALERYHGRFPPPEPRVDTTKDSGRIGRRPFPPPGESVSTNSGPIAVEASWGYRLVPNDTIQVRSRVGSAQIPPRKTTSGHTGPTPLEIKHTHGGIPPECQFFATNTDVHNVTFAICPVVHSSTNLTHNLARRQPHSGDVPNSHIWAIRDTPTCVAPTRFEMRLACGQFDGWLVLAFFIILSMIGVAWLSRSKYRTWRLDEETGTATWPRHSTASTDSSDARPRSQNLRTSTNSAKAALREKIRKARKEDRGLDENISATQYEPVAWRSASQRAIRANVEGSVGHDAWPIAILPRLSAQSPPTYHSFRPLPPHYESNP